MTPRRLPGPGTVRGRGLTRGLLIAAGTALMAYAAIGMLAGAHAQPVRHLLFLAVLPATHDGVLMPLVIGGGLLLQRFVPVALRPVVRTAAIASLGLGAIALPLLIGTGRRPDNPSLVPLDYRLGLLTMLAAVWAAALVAGCWRAVRSRTRGGNRNDPERIRDVSDPRAAR